jgi:hypothetical protein
MALAEGTVESAPGGGTGMPTMSHVIEPASSGRAKCRGCQRPIDKGELRLGERMPNPFGDGDATLWYHLLCAAYKRPEPLLEALGTTDVTVAERELLEREARLGLEHRRLSRIDGADRAPSARAHCRCCREPIPKGEWRVRLVWFEEGRFDPAGFVHLRCTTEYFGTADVLDRVRHFGTGLRFEDLDDLARALRVA